MKNGGKNIYNFVQYVYIYIYNMQCMQLFSMHTLSEKRHTSCHCIGALLKGINMYCLGTNIHFW